MDVDLTQYYSHPKKYLHVHIGGVIAKAQKRIAPLADEKISRLTRLAVIFHDLGKLNKGFQAKLKPNEKNIGYSSHAYLSALAWLCFERENQELSNEWQLTRADVGIIAAAIARHHGNLPNLRTQTGRIFNNQSKSNIDPTEQLKHFLYKTPDKDLPLSNYLHCAKLIGSSHNSFSVIEVDGNLRDDFLDVNLCNVPIDDVLEAYMNVQFSFATLIEADKRDAGYNERYNKDECGARLKGDFGAQLKEKLNRLKQNSSENSRVSALNKLRTEMRVQAVKNLRQHLNENPERKRIDKKRVFSLSAPTGAGKTFMLLQLAAEILKHHEPQENQIPLGIIYTLPFLSITEQTEAICKNILHDQDNAVMRVDSKARNKQIEDLQRQLESNPDDEKLSELMSAIFSENTFDHPFIITTFVQVFETLISNRNATLLRLPNFARAIFLIDEIQALPPRLYTFFTAYLEEFCRRFDSYAIISTATMPTLNMRNEGSAEINPSLLFRRYKKPYELLNEKYFSDNVFNRYRINRLSPELISIDDLAEKISKQTKSCLVVLNTIKDTQELHKKLTEEYADDSCCYILLNTLFTPRDRQGKLKLCKRILNRRKRDVNYNWRVVLISTQLIEAGVDIDFPILYRDMCPLPNLIQSAGRCNRNGEDDFGEVYLFELKRKGGKSPSEIIYGRTLDWFLTFTKNEIKNGMTENEMFDVQRKFFNKVNQDLTVGLHEPENSPSINMVKCINELAFEQLGNFQLIDKDANRSELRFYIPRGRADHQDFLKLKSRIFELKQVYKARNFQQIKLHKSRVEDQMRKLSAKIVNVKVAARDLETLPYGEEVAGIRELADRADYSSSKGFSLIHAGGYFIE
jgi:CRISPR-associated endonuclease/helicase Cas3